ncbi:hypothetical protein [Persicobacter sp. CCB-QB2]|uniref:hypothetical protein n=1 Tax=Persicobacter sp. CCB-QB2 TaxID=1561025 RepID=UPI0006A9B40C|nr:hypothetical protein [Persicobacter sp. CCB-QB2]
MSEKKEALKFPAKYAKQVEAWKKEHGRIKYYEFEGLALFFKLPNRQQLSAAEGIATNEDGSMDLTKKADQLISDCFIGGDLTVDQINDDIEVYVSIVSFCNSKLVEAKKATWGSC